MMIVVVIAAVVLIGGGWMLFGNKASAPADQNQTVLPPERETQPTDESTVSGEVVTFEVSASNFKFSEQEMQVKVGDTVKIVVTSIGGTHDFVLDEFDIKTKVLSSEQSETIEFVADKAGTFEFYCSIGNHRQMGMVGNLIVGE